MLKTIHAADLHLGGLWQKRPRWDDNQRVLAELLDYVEREKIELLIFAGDVIDDRTDPEPGDVLVALIEMLLPTLRRGAGVILMPGNHEIKHRSTYGPVATVLRKVAGTDRLPLLVCSRPGVYDAPGHPELQVIALPYQTRVDLQDPEAFGAPILEGAELNQALGGRLEAGLKWLCENKIDPARPAIFVGHIQINGVVGSGREYTYADDISLPAQALPHFTQYNALGHIHEQQAILGAASPSWYSGSLDRENLGEKDNRPGFLRVDLTLVPGEHCHPIPITTPSPTPFVDLLLSGEERVRAFLDEKHPAHILGRAFITCEPLEFASLRQALIDAHSRLTIERTPTAPDDIDSPTVQSVDPIAVARSVLEERFSGEELNEYVAALEELSQEAPA